MSKRRSAIEAVALAPRRQRRLLVALASVMPSLSLLWWLNNRFLTPVYAPWWELSLLLTIVVTPSMAALVWRAASTERRWTKMSRFLVGECEQCGYDLSAFTPADDTPQRIRCPECGQEVPIARPPNGQW